MAYTYLNDNQGMPYPFFGYGSLPFPMSVVTGLSLCIRSNDTSMKPVYASSVVITETTVQIAVCRKGDNDNFAELLGIFYANTDGYYTYVPTVGNLDPVYEDQTISPQMLRFVYADLSPVQDISMNGEDVTHTVDMDDVVEHIQMFYSYVRNNIPIILGRYPSYGHIQLGSIPKEAIGSYIGEFYLDPSCVVYMPDDVCGENVAYTVNGLSKPLTQAFTIGCTGLLTLSVEGETVTVGTSYESDTVDLVDVDYTARDKVEFINGTTIYANSANPKPSLELVGMEEASFVPVLLTPTTIVVEVESGTAFPNCYGAT